MSQLIDIWNPDLPLCLSLFSAVFYAQKTWKGIYKVYKVLWLDVRKLDVWKCTFIISGEGLHV